MSSRNVLLVALDPVAEDQLRSAIEDRHAGDDVRVRVVAPASNMSALQWLMADEDEARAEAEQLAAETAREVEAEAPVSGVDTEVGDRDPLVAVEDALAEFPADEIVLAGHADPQTEERLRRFGLPVERVGVGDDGANPPEEFAREVARGRSTKTPFVVIMSVGAVILGAAALLSLLLFLVMQLV
jgi:hypothetical protein